MAETKIGGREYRADKLPATEATRTLIRLTKLLGPAFQKLPAVMGTKDEGARNAAALGAIADLLMSSSADELTEFLVQVAEKAKVKNDRGAYEDVIFDLHFTDLSEAFLVVAFVLRVNFKDFFSGKLAAVLQTAAPAA